MYKAHPQYYSSNFKDPAKAPSRWEGEINSNKFFVKTLQLIIMQKSKFPPRGTGGFEGKEYLVKDGDVMHFRFNV